MKVIQACLGDLVQPRRAKAMPSELPNLPFVGMEHVEAHTTRLVTTVAAGTMKSLASRFYPGDTLYGRLRPYLNKVWHADREGLCSGEFIVFPESDRVCGRYLTYRLNAPDVVRYTALLDTGDRPRVDFAGLSQFETLFHADPKDQHRIVAHLDEQFSRLDAGVEALKGAQANLKRYRASVLKSACEGRLVPTEAELARANNPTSQQSNTPTYEHATVLLARILEERRRTWTGKGKYKEPTAPDTTNLPELPEGWTWASVEQLAEVVRGASPRPAGDPRYFGGEIPWITVGPITADSSTYLTAVPTSLNDEGRRHSRYIEPHTLLLTNSGATLGVPKITLIGGCINDGVAALLGVAYPLKLYLHYFLGTLTELLRGVNQGAAQPNLNTTIIKELMVPLPPLLEQERIVAEVERRLSVADALEATLTANLRRATRLRQAVLQRAFSPESSG